MTNDEIRESVRQARQMFGPRYADTTYTTRDPAWLRGWAEAWTQAEVLALEMVASAVAAERERCAKVAENHKGVWRKVTRPVTNQDGILVGEGTIREFVDPTPADIALAIRHMP